MKKLLVFLMLVTGQIAFAQSSSITGEVTAKDSDGLPSASVLLLQKKDSAQVTYTTTDLHGLFQIANVKDGEYILKVTFVGYAPYFKNLTTPATTDTLTLGKIELQPDVINLAEVVFIGQREAVLIKEDTVQFNAGSFNTQANANVEQLLKKLPGVEVERDGSVRVQGQNVERIFIDGKEFFGGDLQMATKNLPADAISAVQVIDDKTEESRFSGIEDGQRHKVINLTLKEKWKKMGFGKAIAGAGTSDRYAVQGNFNRFTNDNQFSVMGTSNNINNQDLGSLGTGEEVPNGRAVTHQGGINFSKQFSKKTRINSSYKIDYTDEKVFTDVNRQNFLPGGTALYYENSQRRNSRNRHTALAGLDYKAARNSIKITTFFNFANANSLMTNSRQSYSVADTLVNAGERTSATRNQNYNFKGNVFYGHRFRKAGRVFTVTNQISALRVNANGNANSFTRFSDGKDETVRQLNKQDNTGFDFNTQLAYTEPLGKKQYLQTTYTVTNRSSESDLVVHDIVNETRLFNAEQSSRFSSDFLYQQVGLTYRLSGKKYNLAVGSTLQQSTLSRLVPTDGDEVKRTFQNVLPKTTLNIRIKKSTRTSLTYSTSVREPTINQLQPVLSRFDPLKLYVGNPGLRPEYSHRGRLNFTTFSAPTGIFLSGSLSMNYTTNPIAMAVSIDERQVRTTRYVNLDRRENVAAFLNAGFPLKKWNSRINLGPFLRQDRSQNILNGITGAVNQRSFGSNIGYTYSYKENVELVLGAYISATSSDYELNQNQNQFFVNSVYTADTRVQFLKAYAITAAFNYSRFRNRQTSFDQAIPILNLALSRYVLKDNKGEVRLSGHNLFDQSVGATQVATINYVEQSVQNTLGRYYMLSFLYNFKLY